MYLPPRELEQVKEWTEKEGDTNVDNGEPGTIAHSSSLRQQVHLA